MCEQQWKIGFSTSTRQGYKFQPSDDLGEAEPGSLEFFLVERYRLFSGRNGQLLTGRVYHPPYQPTANKRSSLS
jgi:uncharacterized protein